MKTMEAPFGVMPLKPALPETAPGAARSRLADYVSLGKPRIALLVLFTVAVGFVLGCNGVPNWLLLTHTLIGTGLVALGAAALNEVLERDTDALMERTQDRPLPAGRLSTTAGLRFGALAGSAGFVYLAAVVNPLTGLLAVFTLASYVFVYTPLKRVTTFNTVVGALPGAMPPLLGWAAATGQLSLEAAALFLILFLWQFPHFWAIAWMHRHDYARAKLRMVPVLDREGGKMTGRLMLHHCLVLIPATLVPTLIGMAGQRYFLGALILGIAFLLLALRFWLAPSRQRARQMMWGSLAYLPAIWTLLLWDGVLWSIGS